MKTISISKRLVIRLYDFNKRCLLNRKAKRILSGLKRRMTLGPPPAGIVSEHTRLWKVTGQKVNPAWITIYGNVSGRWDKRYIPESTYYCFIEPVLNNKSFSKCYTDKNFYSTILSDYNLPATILSNINGTFYNTNGQILIQSEASDILGSCKRVIIKPAVDSGGGRGVSLLSGMNDGFVSESGEFFETECLFKKYGKDYIIQEVIEQHPYYARFNQTSLNTVRVLTYRSCSDERIHILHSVLRVGAEGRITDNQASGGYACGMTPEGSLTGSAVDKYGNVFAEVNGNLLVRGEKPFGINLIMETAIKIAPRFHYSRLIGMDLCIDSGGLCRVIEVNNLNNEINFFQMTAGPLFGDFTDEVIAYCTNNRRSFMIDFEI